MNKRMVFSLVCVALAPTVAFGQFDMSKSLSRVSAFADLTHESAGMDMQDENRDGEAFPMFTEGVKALATVAGVFTAATASQDTLIEPFRIVSGATVGADLSDIDGAATWASGTGQSELLLLFVIDEPHTWTFTYGSVFGTNGIGVVEMFFDSGGGGETRGDPAIFSFESENTFDGATGTIEPGVYFFRAAVTAGVCTGDCEVVVPTRGGTGPIDFADAGWDFELVLEPATPPPCEGDADRDGDVDFADVTSVLTFWGTDYTPGTGEGDANYNGPVNFADITSVLKNFGFCFKAPPVK